MLRIESDRFGSTLVELWDQEGEKRFSQCCVLASGMNTVYLNTNLPVGIYQIRIGNHTDPVTIVPSQKKCKTLIYTPIAFTVTANPPHENM